MCELCRDLDERTEQCRALETRTTDQTMLDGIALLVEQYVAEKTSCDCGANR